MHLKQQLQRRLDILQTRARTRRAESLAAYVDDPIGYCRDVLRVVLTADQEAIARSLLVPPFKTLVRTGHVVGKSFVAGCLVNWWFDTQRPGIALTTAPTERQVADILWKEVRLLRRRRGGWIGPRSCRLQASPDHYAHGFAARDSQRFQGIHGGRVLIIFDEATGIDAPIWEAAQAMLTGERFAFLALYNPTDTGSRVYQEEREPGYHQLTMSCLDHPNIAAELSGRPAPYPAAITLNRLRELLERWSTPIVKRDAGAGDVCLGERWYRPGPIAEARLLGRWPRHTLHAVWSEVAWQRAESAELPNVGRLQIGCDVARYGDDDTAFHVRRGGVSLHHESRNGSSVVETVQRLQELAEHWGRSCHVAGREVVIAVDDAGVGGGVVDLGQAGGWKFVPVLGAQRPADGDEYPNMRSALWFGVADEAARGNISVARLSKETRAQLRLELLAPTYSLDAFGRRVVEPKERTKARLKRSPDNADAFNLAYANVRPTVEQVSGRIL